MLMLILIIIKGEKSIRHISYPFIILFFIWYETMTIYKNVKLGVHFDDILYKNCSNKQRMTIVNTFKTY